MFVSKLRDGDFTGAACLLPSFFTNYFLLPYSHISLSECLSIRLKSGLCPVHYIFLCGGGANKVSLPVWRENPPGHELMSGLLYFSLKQQIYQHVFLDSFKYYGSTNYYYEKITCASDKSWNIYICSILLERPECSSPDIISRPGWFSRHTGFYSFFVLSLINFKAVC